MANTPPEGDGQETNESTLDPKLETPATPTPPARSIATAPTSCECIFNKLAKRLNPGDQPFRKNGLMLVWRPGSYGFGRGMITDGDLFNETALVDERVAFPIIWGIVERSKYKSILD